MPPIPQILIPIAPVPRSPLNQKNHLQQKKSHQKIQRVPMTLNPQNSNGEITPTPGSVPLEPLTMAMSGSEPLAKTKRIKIPTDGTQRTVHDPVAGEHREISYSLKTLPLSVSRRWPRNPLPKRRARNLDFLPILVRNLWLN